jgi:nitroreductase
MEVAMTIDEAIRKNRSCRRFKQQERLTVSELKDLVNLARLSPSGGNLQPLKFMLSNKPATNAVVFKRLAWAGYLKDWNGPAEGERPAAYIIIVGDKKIAASPGCDHGIAAQSIMLGATARGFGGCMLGAIDRKGLRKDLSIPAQYDILLVLALGRPKERIAIEIAKGGDIKYWRDKKGTHHVPKRPLKELIL